MKHRQLPKAQRRVLHLVARANNAGATWCKYTYRHDYQTMRKLARRGYISYKVSEYGRSGDWVIIEFLTPKGWAASGIPPDHTVV